MENQYDQMATTSLDALAGRTTPETPADDQDYQVPFEFTGKLDKLTIAVERPKLTPRTKSG